MLDATSIKANQLNGRNHTLITQVYSTMVAGDLKVTLMERYKDEHIVYIVDGAKGMKRKLLQCRFTNWIMKRHDLQTLQVSSFLD